MEDVVRVGGWSLVALQLVGGGRNRVSGRDSIDVEAEL